MTATIPASGEARQAPMHEQTESLSHAARCTIAGTCADTEQFRELSLMLGLTTVDSDTGSLVTTNPWETDFSDLPAQQPAG